MKTPSRTSSQPSKPATKSTSSFRKSGKRPPLDATFKQIVLKTQLFEAWRETVNHFFRAPRGTSKKDLSPQELLKLAVRQEMHTVEELWEVFTQERSRLGKHLLSPMKHVVGYLLGFHLPNAARMQALIERTLQRSNLAAVFKTCERLIINDVGCGTGAMSQALVIDLVARGIPGKIIEVHLSDLSATLLEAAQFNLAALGVACQVIAHKKRVEELPIDKFHDQPRDGAAPLRTIHVYTLGYVWNELRKNTAAKKRLADILRGHVEKNEDALVFVIEPATEMQSRDAMEFRNAVVDLEFHPVYPCPAAGPCPMLERARDWCFSEERWDRPSTMAFMDRALGIDRSKIAASMYSFVTPRLAARLKLSPTEPQKLSVVVGRPDTEPLQKGGAKRFEYLVCTPDGLSKIVPVPNAPLVLRGLTLPKV